MRGCMHGQAFDFCMCMVYMQVFMPMLLEAAASNEDSAHKIMDQNGTKQVRQVEQQQRHRHTGGGYNHTAQ